MRRLLLGLVLAALAAPAPAVAYRGPVPILTYHEVRAAPHGARSPASASLWVSSSRFTAQMQALAAAGYHGVTLSQAWAAWHGGPALPAQPVVVSFDDGYASQYEVAAPVLDRLGWPAVLDLETSRLDVHEGLSTDRVHRLLGRGWELASHSVTHPDLRHVGRARLKQEIAGSRAVLRQRFAVAVDFFCYPFGRRDAAARAAVRAAGYTGATTTSAGLASPTRNRLALPRITVPARYTGAQLVMRLRG